MASPSRFKDISAPPPPTGNSGGKYAARPKPAAGPQVTVTGIVNRVRYHNPEDNYYILIVKGPNTQGKSSFFTVAGKAAVEMKPGMLITATGTKGEYNREVQIKTEFIQEKLPVSPQGIEAYLASGTIAGIGPVLAKVMVQKWGTGVFDILDKHPGELSYLEGVGQKTQRKIEKAWKARRESAQVMAFLAGHGIGPGIGLRIFRALGEDCVPKIEANPYALTTVPMVGFRTADGVAKSLGIQPDSPFRIASFLKYQLEQSGTEGHTMVQQQKLVASAVHELKVSAEQIQVVLAQEMSKGELVARREADGFFRTASDDVRFSAFDFVSTRQIYSAEQSVVKHFERLCSDPAKKIAKSLNFSKFDKVMADVGMSFLDPDQRDAVKRTLESKASVITGGPGCGKTTVTKAIVAMIEANKLKFKLCAPTGRAARRMAEATGKEASTAHTLLGARGAGGGFVHHDGNPLDVDVLIIDEASMADTYLASSLLKAIPDHARVIFVGDSDQLPSVGAGNVLNDIIVSGAMPVSRLTKIHRQAEGNPIIQNSHAIISGKMPPKLEDEFLMVEKKNEEIAPYIGRIIDILVKGDFQAHEIQILAPMKDGDAGTHALNALARDLLNPDKGQASAALFGTTYRVGDRVMQLKNDRDNDISNGDMGHITHIDAEEKEVTIDFGNREVTMAYDDCGSLTISYACTVHKSQGSEFPVVIMPMTMSHYVMLNRNIFYTAVTRAKERVFLVGEKRALQHAVHARNTSVRSTGLTRMLKDAAARLGIQNTMAEAMEQEATNFASFDRPDLRAVNF